jgi:WD40 repeat protein
MNPISRTFRVFVSSTFSDLIVERNALQERVFPRLRELAMAHGCRFQAIDLRWGVSEEATLDQQTMKICLGEIERCQKTSPRPNFIVLLGNRYGWRPLPYEIPNDEYEKIISSIYGNDKLLLEQWYQRDDNADPGVHVLQPRMPELGSIPGTEFNRLITDPGMKPKNREILEAWYKPGQANVPIPSHYFGKFASDQVIYTFQPATDHAATGKMDEHAIVAQIAESYFWQCIETRMHTILERSTTDFPNDTRLKYTASATEQEIMAGALKVIDAPKHVFCYIREISELPQDSSAVGFVDVDFKDQAKSEVTHNQAHFFSRLFRANRSPNDADDKPAQMLADLKAKLQKYLPDNTQIYPSQWKEKDPSLDHIEQLCADVFRDLEKVIRGEIAQLEEVDPLVREIVAHEDFSHERTRNFKGRENFLASIASYLNQSNSFTYAVWGESGCGKSALMARSVQKARDTQPQAALIYRFIGATPESSSGRALLESLCRQITRDYDGDESSIPLEYKELIQEFPKRLALATPTKPLILYLDALDQLSAEDNARNLAWLPLKSPPNVKIVVSTLKGECFKALEGRLPPTNLLEVLGMPLAEGQAALQAWLKEAKRTLQPEQKQRVLSRFGQCGLPLYLKLLFEEARRWKSYDPISELTADIPGMIRQLFKRLSLESNHGEILVARGLGYLAAARNGLAEDELLEVLSRDHDIYRAFLGTIYHTPTDLIRTVSKYINPICSSDTPDTNLKEAEAWFNNQIKVNEAELEKFLTYAMALPDGPRLPVVLWSRLYFDLESYLTEHDADGTSLLVFYHRQLAEVISADYLKENLKQERHQALADYFTGQRLFLETKEKMQPNLRKLSEQPYQQASAGLKDSYYKTLTDYSFLETKVEAFSAQALATDYDFSYSLQGRLTHEEYKSLSLIQKSIRLSAKVINQDKHQLAGQLFGRLLGKDNLLVKKFLSMVREKADVPWLCPLTPSLASPDASLLFTIDQPKTVCSYSQDGKSLFTADSGKFSTLDAETGAEIKTIRVKSKRTLIYEEEFKDFSLDGKRIASHFFGGDATEIRIWNFETGEVIKSPIFSGYGKFSPNGHLFAAVSMYSTKTQGPPQGPPIIYQDIYNLVIGNIETGERVFELKDIPVNISFVLSHDNRKIMVSRSPNREDKQSNPPYVNVIYDFYSGNILSSCNILPTLGNTYSSLVFCEAFSPDDKMILYVDEVYIHDRSREESVICLRDATNGTLLQSFRGHQKGVHECYFSPDGKRIFSRSDQTLKIWDVDKGIELTTISSLPDIRSFLISPNGKRLVTLGDSLCVWDMESFCEETSIEAHTGSINACCFSGDGKILVSASNDSLLKFWDPVRHVEVKTEDFHSNSGIASCDISPDGSKVVAVGEMFCGKVLETNSGKEISTFVGSYQSTKCAFSPDGKFVITTGMHDRVYFWDSDRGTQIASHPILSERPHWVGPPHTYCIFSPDGNKVASPGDNYSTISIWEASTGFEIMRLSGHHQYPDSFTVRTCSFSPDGKRLVSASSDSTMELWDIEQGIQLKHLIGHGGGVNSCCFSSDGRLIVSTGDDKTLRVWESDSGKLVATFSAMGKINCSAFSSSQNLICCGDSEGILYFLELVGIQNIAR